MKRTCISRSNLREAREKWGEISVAMKTALIDLTNRWAISVACGDIQLLNGNWYITHAGLLRIAHRRKCSSLITIIDKKFSDASACRWVFKATVYKSIDSKGFVGYGDADPSNVSSAVQGAEMRIAETRAVNRALRKAYGIGICSVEELGSIPAPKSPSGENQPLHSASGNHSSNGQPRLRDQLCILIRQHSLNPALVKAYAADFCGTATLSGASRELVESFISHLSTAAKENRDSLICKLNSYTGSVEVQP